MKKNTYSDVTEGSTDHIFQDPTVAKSLEEDPMLRFVVTHWRSFLVVIVAVMAVVYARSVFQETSRASSEAASETFSKLREDLDVYREAKIARAKFSTEEPQEAKAKEEFVKSRESAVKQTQDMESRITEQLRVLGDTKEPYKTFGKIYEGVFAAEKGENEKALQSFSSLSWTNIPDSSDRMIVEVAALRAARLLVDTELPKGKAALKTLAEEGHYSNVAAAIALARLATSPEERLEALTLLTTLQASYVEQTKLLEPEIKKLQ